MFLWTYLYNQAQPGQAAAGCSLISLNFRCWIICSHPVPVDARTFSMWHSETEDIWGRGQWCRMWLPIELVHYLDCRNHLVGCRFPRQWQDDSVFSQSVSPRVREKALNHAPDLHFPRVTNFPHFIHFCWCPIRFCGAMFEKPWILLTPSRFAQSM